MKIKHYYAVAKQFSIFTEHFWLGFCHDLVEDGYLTPKILKYWKSLDAITRRKDEVYSIYIRRVSENSVAKEVKIADLKVNLLRCNHSLAQRYLKSLKFLQDEIF